MPEHPQIEPADEHQEVEQPARNDFIRFGGAIAILVSGLAWEHLVVAVHHHYFLGAGSCLAFPFWPLAFLWWRVPSKVALLFSVPVTFGLVAATYWFIDLKSSSTSSIGLGLICILVVPLATGVSYAFGLLICPPRK